jgi:hypothetical protein
MVFMIPGVYQPGKKVDANFAPDAEMVAKMSRFSVLANSLAKTSRRAAGY